MSISEQAAPEFTQAFRGYDRAQVDEYVVWMRDQVAPVRGPAPVAPRPRSRSVAGSWRRRRPRPASPSASPRCCSWPPRRPRTSGRVLRPTATPPSPTPSPAPSGPSTRRTGCATRSNGRSTTCRRSASSCCSDSSSSAAKSSARTRALPRVSRPAAHRSRASTATLYDADAERRSRAASTMRPDERDEPSPTDGSASESACQRAVNTIGNVSSERIAGVYTSSWPSFTAYSGMRRVPLAQRDPQLEAGEVRAEAAVHAAAERVVRVHLAVEAHLVGVGQRGLVGVDRAEADAHHVALARSGTRGARCPRPRRA